MRGLLRILPCVSLDTCSTRFLTRFHMATHCNTPQHAATHHNTLQQHTQHVARYMHGKLSHACSQCNTLQHATAHCNNTPSVSLDTWNAKLLTRFPSFSNGSWQSTGVLRYGVVRCDMSWSVALSCCVLQVRVVCCSVLRCFVMSCIVLHRVAVCCICAQQCVAVCSSV